MDPSNSSAACVPSMIQQVPAVRTRSRQQTRHALTNKRRETVQNPCRKRRRCCVRDFWTGSETPHWQQFAPEVWATKDNSVLFETHLEVCPAFLVSLLFPSPPSHFPKKAKLFSSLHPSLTDSHRLHVCTNFVPRFSTTE